MNIKEKMNMIIMKDREAIEKEQTSKKDKINKILARKTRLKQKRVECNAE